VAGCPLSKKMMGKIYDVIIIGGGIMGGARPITKYIF
jgi:hypothetical protein